MQELPKTILDELRRGLQHNFLVASPFNSPTELPFLQDFEVVSSELNGGMRRRAVQRSFGLVRPGDPTAFVRVGVVLAVDGSDSALEYLKTFCGGMQRQFPTQIETLPSQAHPIGAGGVAWSWGQDESLVVIAVLRSNLLVTVTEASGVDPYAVAQAIDARVMELPAVDPVSGNPYYPAPPNDAIEPMSVPPGGRLPLNQLPAAPHMTLFPLVPEGSVDPDADEPLRWQYLAPLTLGPQRIDVLAVDQSMVPSGWRIDVVVEELP